MLVDYRHSICHACHITHRACSLAHTTQHLSQVCSEQQSSSQSWSHVCSQALFCDAWARGIIWHLLETANQHWAALRYAYQRVEWIEELRSGVWSVGCSVLQSNLKQVVYSCKAVSSKVRPQTYARFELKERRGKMRM